MSPNVKTSIGNRLNQLLMILACIIAISVVHTTRAAADDATPTTAPSSELSITIDGDVQHTLSWTPDSLATQFASDIKTIKCKLSGKDAQCRCVPLMDLINAATPAFDQDHIKQELQFVAAVSARDNFTICFSLGELLPAFGNSQVWVALDKDGKPLPGPQAPVRLIVPNDGKQGRWIYGATHIKIIRLGLSAPTPAPTTQP
jgi:hypothetical protein